MTSFSTQYKRVQQARTALLLDQPFFGVLALRLKLREDETCKTGWTDGTTLGFNPAFVDTLSQSQLLGLVAHEVMHCACGHPWRRGSRDHKRFNVAADYAINSILKEARFALPDGALIDAQYAGKSAEWIYDRLPEGQDGEGGQDGSGQGEVRDAPEDGMSGPGEGGETDGQTDTPSDVQSEGDWQQAAKQAEKIAQAQGKLPGSLARGIGEATRDQCDWRSLLRKYVQETCKADYSWTRPNTRYLAGGLYLPSLHSRECGRIVCAVDTSGSIDDVTLAQFCSEINAIASEVSPSRIDVIMCDAEINHTQSFDRGELVTMSACGGGGTDFNPVFDHVDESEDGAPAVLIYLTDLYGSFPDVAPDYPVIWACTSGQTAPFGDTVPIE